MLGCPASLLLGALARRHLFSLGHSVLLVDLGGCLTSLPYAEARLVLGSLLPLLPVHAPFARQLMLLMHKLLAHPEARGRRVAVHAFCSVLRSNLLPTGEAATDAALALRAACGAPLAQRPHAFRELRAVLLAG